MIQRIYINNFKCFENFEIKMGDLSSALIIGKNGSGKTSFLQVIELFQKIGRGINRVGDLISPQDFSYGRTEIPMRFEFDFLIDKKQYKYAITFELPEKFSEARIKEEKLDLDGREIYSRNLAQIRLQKSAEANATQFSLDWFLIALPVIHQQSISDPISVLKTWLAQMIILTPIPKQMDGNSSGTTFEPNKTGTNFGEWFTGLLGRYPAAYTTIINYLKGIMFDIADFTIEPIGKNAKSLNVRFSVDGKNYFSTEFAQLSDGEKCFFLCALVVSAQDHYGPLFCFWDEPDNYLAISEVGFFVSALRRSFQNGGQVFMTSHNSEAIQKFANQNTFVFERSSHLEPTRVKTLEEANIQGSLINALIRGDDL
jgi:predicted ATPase